MTDKDKHQSNQGGDKIKIKMGDNPSQVAAGKQVQLVVSSQSNIQITQADMEAVRKLFASFRDDVAAKAPPEKKEAALERVNELEEALVTKEPDLTTAEYVKRWFGKNIPKLSDAVKRLLLEPIVMKLIEAGGNIATEELKRRLGG